MTSPERDPFAPVELVAPDGDRARVLPYGAHVVSWTPLGGGERLFVSERTRFERGAAVRGGVPVIFPQFASEGPLPKHGFARTAEWAFAGVTHDAGYAAATFRLADTPETRALWPHAFVAELVARVGGASLAVELRVTNAGDAALSFTAALHTYLRVSDVRHVSLGGLRGARYRDQAADNVERVDDTPALRVDREVDRVYFDAPRALAVYDNDEVVRVAAEGFPDVVVWNPWAEKARALDDMEADGYLRMLCVEAAAVGRPVRLAPGERWAGRQTLTVRAA